MAVLKDTEETPVSPEDDSRAYLGTHSTEDLPAAIQAEPYARPAGVGSSHTKISFVPAKDDGDDNDYQNKAESSHPRHRSPPPYLASHNEHETATAGGSGGNDVWTNNDLPVDMDGWDNNGFSLLEDGNNEKMWWNASNRKALRPLGPGFLPVLTASKIHEESHTLMAITVTPPDLPIGTVDTGSDTSRPFKQPRQSDVTSAVPHPNAYYCSKCNGWVIVRSALTSEPPIYSSYKDACPELNFPSARVDKRCNSQWHSLYGGGSGGPDPLEAHHYHLYEDSIPSTSLNPPFARSSWEQPPCLPRKLCSQHESTTENFWKLPTNIMLEVEPEEMHDGVDRTADYLDLYACCVCTQNIYVTRKVIPGVVSPRLLMDLRRERAGVDRNPARVAIAFEFIIKCSHNSLEISCPI
jgi:ubiquitin carboxyl-terminal hydrolase 25/28